MAELPKNGVLDTFLVVFLNKVDFSCMLYIIYIAKRSQTYTTLKGLILCMARSTFSVKTDFAERLIADCCFYV